MKYLLSEIYYTLNELFTPLGKNNRELYRTLKNDGIVLMPNHIQGKEIDELISVVIDKEYNWISPDRADQRIYGLEIGEIEKWLGFERIYAKYINRFRCDSFWMFGNLEYRKKNKGSGGGWHRDSLHRRQLKVMIYLSDVVETSGPFEYIKGSHKVRSKLSLELSLGLGKFRYSSDEINRYSLEKGKSITRCLGGPGTVVIFDSSGLHRGMPIRSGTRMALTKYMFDSGVPSEILKIYNEKV